MLRTLRRALPRLGRWPRLGAVAICLLLALDSAVDSLHAHTIASRTVAVVVAARAVPAGHTLTAADLALARWPTKLCPNGTTGRLRSLLGKRTAGPLPRRDAVTSAQLVGTDLSAGLPPGEAALTVELTDPRAGELVNRGNRIDLLATPLADEADDPSSSVHDQVDTVAQGVLVLDVLPLRGADQTELIIAADQATTLAITGRRNSDSFTAVVISP